MGAFILVRHGSASYDLAEARRLRGGMRDWVPLSPRGVEEAEAAAARLKGTSARLILSSPMTRALQTAAILSRRLDLPLAVEFDLHEWLPDLTQTYDSSKVVADAAEEMARCGGEWPEGASRSWEPLSQVRRRVLDVLRRNAQPDGVIVVCHGTVIAALTGRSLGCGEQTLYALPPAAQPLPHQPPRQAPPPDPAPPHVQPAVQSEPPAHPPRAGR